MGYWISGQVRTMTRSVTSKINSRMRENILRRVLMMPCAVLSVVHLSGASSIALLGSGRGRVGGLGGAI